MRFIMTFLKRIAQFRFYLTKSEVLGSRVHLKPSCYSLARLPKFYGGQALTVDSWVMTCHASAASRREAERMKTERLEDIES